VNKIYVLMVNNGGGCLEEYDFWIHGVYTDREVAFEEGKRKAETVPSDTFGVGEWERKTGYESFTCIYTYMFFKYKGKWYKRLGDEN